MKKKVRRLRLERETLRNLTPEHLQRVNGGVPLDDTDTLHNSCDIGLTRPRFWCCTILLGAC